MRLIFCSIFISHFIFCCEKCSLHRFIVHFAKEEIIFPFIYFFNTSFFTRKKSVAKSKSRSFLSPSTFEEKERLNGKRRFIVETKKLTHANTHTHTSMDDHTQNRVYQKLWTRWQLNGMRAKVELYKMVLFSFSLHVHL